MNVRLLKAPDKPEHSITVAAKICYSAKTFEEIEQQITTESAYSFVRMLKSLGHESALEHVSFTFGVEGISRAATHQLVRHRLASYSQQSQRYVSMKNAGFVIPESIENDPKALARFEDCLKMIQTTYEELTRLDIPKEDARYILPNACMSNIVITMNARELLHFFALRCCNRAQWEIRRLAQKMLDLVKDVAPVIFENAGPECVRASCPEGKMSCGQAKQMRQRYGANVDSQTEQATDV